LQPGRSGGDGSDIQPRIHRDRNRIARQIDLATAIGLSNFDASTMARPPEPVAM